MAISEWHCVGPTMPDSVLGLNCVLSVSCHLSVYFSCHWIIPLFALRSGMAPLAPSNGITDDFDNCCCCDSLSSSMFTRECTRVMFSICKVLLYFSLDDNLQCHYHFMVIVGHTVCPNDAEMRFLSTPMLPCKSTQLERSVKARLIAQAMREQGQRSKRFKSW